MSADVAVGLKALSAGHSVALVKSGAVLAAAAGGGIRPFLEVVDVAGAGACGATLVDRVVGKAVALLAVHFGIARVHAHVMSRPGLDVLKGEGIPTTHDRLVDRILNRDGSDMCPVEKMAGDMRSPAEAAERFRAMLGQD